MKLFLFCTSFIILVFFISCIESEELCPNVKMDVLSRKRRSLSFPDGSTFVATIALLKAILIGIPLGWNVALEIDVIFPTPGWFELLRYKYPRLGLHHKQRRDVWEKIENVLNIYNVNGEACILRMLCESQLYLAPKNSYFLHDILRTVFTLPDVAGPRDKYSKALDLKDCSIFQGRDKCPFSLLQALLSYRIQ